MTSYIQLHHCDGMIYIGLLYLRAKGPYLGIII